MPPTKTSAGFDTPVIGTDPCICHQLHKPAQQLPEGYLQRDSTILLLTPRGPVQPKRS